MRIIGEVLLTSYYEKIVNIHPSLLPSFPGINAIDKAFFYGVKISGVTIHYVNKGMDTGTIIAQKAIDIKSGMTKVDMERKIHRIEHLLYKKVLEEILSEDIYEEKSIN